MSPRLCRISAKKECLIYHRSSIFYSTYKFRLQLLLISCLYLCSTYKFTAYATFCHSEHFLRINLVHSMHLTEFTINPFFQSPHSLRQGSSSFCCLPQASSFHCSFTRFKTLNHFFHRHWRLRQYLSYTCSCNWYMNGKFFTSTTEWKQKIKFSFRKMSKLNFDLYFDLCRSVEFTLVSAISVLH